MLFLERKTVQDLIEINGLLLDGFQALADSPKAILHQRAFI